MKTALTETMRRTSHEIFPDPFVSDTLRKKKQPESVARIPAALGTNF